MFFLHSQITRGPKGLKDPILVTVWLKSKYCLCWASVLIVTLLTFYQKFFNWIYYITGITEICPMAIRPDAFCQYFCIPITSHRVGFWNSAERIILAVGIFAHCSKAQNWICKNNCFCLLVERVVGFSVGFFDSVNNINTLNDFQYCLNLRDLFVRKNNIKDLNEVCYLQNLLNLRNLWLDENPCAEQEGWAILFAGRSTI